MIEGDGKIALIPIGDVIERIRAGGVAPRFPDSAPGRAIKQPNPIGAYYAKFIYRSGDSVGSAVFHVAAERQDRGAPTHRHGPVISNAALWLVLPVMLTMIVRPVRPAMASIKDPCGVSLL